MSDLDDLDQFVIEPHRTGSAKRIRAGIKRAHAVLARGRGKNRVLQASPNYQARESMKRRGVCVTLPSTNLPEIEE
jgi:hypothetical protein